MKKLLLSICICAPLCAFAQTQGKVQTIIAKGYSNNVPLVASFTIPTNEAARIVTVLGSGTSSAIPTIEKDGIFFPYVWTGTIVGPAALHVTFQATTETHDSDGAFLTFERWRVPKAVPVR